MSPRDVSPRGANTYRSQPGTYRSQADSGDYRLPHSPNAPDASASMLQDADGNTWLRSTENYMRKNPTAPPCMKSYNKCSRLLEHNLLCRGVGCIGPKIMDKARVPCMSFAAFLTFALICLSVIPLLAATPSASTVATFNLAQGEAEWELIIPSDWCDKFYVGLNGITNQTKKGDLFYNRFTSDECQQVFGPACDSCNAGATTAWTFLIIGLIVLCLCFILDIQRIFEAWDMNLSKSLALWFHVVCGIVNVVLPFVIFQTACFDSLPVERLEHRKVGLEITWSLTEAYTIMLVMVIVRPIPGLIHLLMPTPPWAHKKPGAFAKGKSDPANQSTNRYQQSNPATTVPTTQWTERPGTSYAPGMSVTRPRSAHQDDGDPTMEYVPGYAPVSAREYRPYNPQMDSVLSAQSQPGSRPETYRTDQMDTTRGDYGPLMSSRAYVEGADSLQPSSLRQTALRHPTVSADGTVRSTSVPAGAHSQIRPVSPTATEPDESAATAPGTPTGRGQTAEFQDPFAHGSVGQAPP